MKALQLAIEKDPYPIMVARNKAILAVSLDTGIRAGELCRLTLEDVCITEKEVYLVVLGKGLKQREVPLGKQASHLLQEYLKYYRPQDSGIQAVFLTHGHEPLNACGLSHAFCRWGRSARITRARCSAHTCRHTYAINYLLQGGDVYKLSRLLGHASMMTTEIYLRAMTAIQARTHSKSVLDHLLDGESEKKTVLTSSKAVSMPAWDGKSKEATSEEYAQWTAFLRTWHEQLGGRWVGVSEALSKLSEMLPHPLEYEAEKHQRSVLMVGTALRKRSGVFYGENRLALQSRSRPGLRGTHEWQVYQVRLPRQKKTG